MIGTIRSCVLRAGIAKFHESVPVCKFGGKTGCHWTQVQRQADQYGYAADSRGEGDDQDCHH